MAKRNYILRFCSTCKKETRHLLLKQMSFFQQCAVAVVTKGKCDLREPEHECNNCGTKE